MSNTTDPTRLRELLGAATKGPWEVECVQTSVGRCFKIGPFPSRREDRPNWACVYDDSYGGVSHGNEELKANAHCITELHNAAPSLLDELDALRARVAELEAERESLAKTCSWCGCSPVLEACADDCVVKQTAHETLVARDARMKREGAAEWLEQEISKSDCEYYERSIEGMREEAARLREGGE